jgi:hypothetical protein
MQILKHLDFVAALYIKSGAKIQKGNFLKE